MSRVDAIVLAGTHTDKKKLICGQNKAFLPVGGGICLGLVLDALRRARQVGRIFVVGPEELLRNNLPPDEHRYFLVAQKGRMLDNALAACQEAEASLPPDLPARNRLDRPYLLITSDVPLAVPEAVDDFVERSLALESAGGGMIDFLVGVADELALAPFYPRPPRRGIQRPYMELKHRRLRLANIYLIRPRRIRNLEILQQGFTARKLKKWRSFSRLITTFLRSPGGLRGAFHIACFQTVSVLDSLGLSWLAAAPRQFLQLATVERAASAMLGCRFAAVVTPYGGLSLDLDDEADYDILRENLTVWREHQRTLIPPELEFRRVASKSPGASPRLTPPPAESA